MHRFLIITAVLGIAVIAGDAQAPAESQKSPKEAVEQFYKMETEGRWLGPEHWDELQDFLTRVVRWSAPEALANVEPVSPPDCISVLRSYKVGAARKDIGAGGVVDYQVEVEYHEWGSINSFLNFTRARTPEGRSPALDEPVEWRGEKGLVLTDKYLKSGPSGEEQRTGALRWRITSPIYTPRVDIDTAFRWVTEMRDKSNDPAIRYNAERTLAILKSLSRGGPLLAQPAGTTKESPSKIAQRFVRQESRLLPGQWSELAIFFVETPKPQWDKAWIVDIAGIDVDINGDFGHVSVSTNSLGHLDSSLRLLEYPSGPPAADSACLGDDYFGFNMLLSERHWQTATDGTVKEIDGPLGWRIEDTSFEPLLTLDTSIRYVTQVRDQTTDPVVKRHASRTLSILNYYKQGKPLPNELASHASRGCGG